MSFARSDQFSVKNGKADEFKRILNTEVLPLLQKEKGFRQALAVLDKNAGMSISVWDDRASAEAYQSKTHPTVLKTLDTLLEGTPSVRTYETVFSLIPDVVRA